MTGEEVPASPAVWAGAVELAGAMGAACERLSQLSTFHKYYRDRAAAVAAFDAPFQQWAAEIDQVAAAVHSIAAAAVALYAQVDNA